ncbi:Sm-like ribonucleo protein [Testicularia cyperi]|uniref:Sm protein B n=1 Tax=Testicularia cyperi TaxID=1882483 RepID=A0A317XIM2_9BASI|nr:Sm-like ribonucleo protein [Testicularia cyperi]
MPPTKPKGGKMMSLINYRLRITLNDSRQIVGQLLAFDAHMNLVLADSQEFRKIKSKKSKARTGATSSAAKDVDGDGDDDDAPTPGAAAGGATEQKRTLGLLILRGENIVSMAIEAPPPADTKVQPAMQPGPGRGAPMGRGMGLAAPPVGVPPSMMARPPMPYARPPPPGMPGMPMPPGMPTGPPPGFRPPGFQGMPPTGPPPGFVPHGGAYPPRPPPGYPMPPRPQ